MSKAKITDLKFDDRNANRGTVRGRGVIETSIQRSGFGRSVLIDKNGKLIAGNKSVEVAGELGFEDVVIVPSDGKSIIAVQRIDLDLDTDEEARLLALRDNRSGELSLDWDLAILKELRKELDLGDLWTNDELSDLFAGMDQEDDGDDRGSGRGSDQNKEIECKCPHCGKSFIRAIDN